MQIQLNIVGDLHELQPVLAVLAASKGEKVPPCESGTRDVPQGPEMMPPIADSMPVPAAAEKPKRGRKETVPAEATPVDTEQSKPVQDAPATIQKAVDEFNAKSATRTEETSQEEQSASVTPTKHTFDSLKELATSKTVKNPQAIGQILAELGAFNEKGAPSLRALPEEKYDAFYFKVFHLP